MNSVMSATRPSVATSTVKISAPRSKIREIESQKDSRSLTKNVRNLLDTLHFNINNFMNFEIIYKKVKSFISRIANKWTIYGKVGREQAIFPARK